MPYTRASVHVKSAYFWFILSSRVRNHHKGRVVFMGAIFCSSWIPFYSPSVTYGSKGIPNVEPLLWICLLLDVYLVLPRHLFSSLMFLERWFFTLPWLFSCLHQEGCSELAICHYQERISLHQFKYVHENNTDELCFFYQTDTLFFKREKSIPAYSIWLFYSPLC